MSTSDRRSDRHPERFCSPKDLRHYCGGPTCSRQRQLAAPAHRTSLVRRPRSVVGWLEWFLDRRGRRQNVGIDARGRHLRGRRLDGRWLRSWGLPGRDGLGHGSAVLRNPCHDPRPRRDAHAAV